MIYPQRERNIGWRINVALFHQETDATRIIKLRAGLLSRQSPCVLIRSHIRILAGGTRRQGYPPSQARPVAELMV